MKIMEKCMNHNECAKSYIQSDYLITNTFNSKFAQFFETKEYIFKVRIKDSRLFLSSDIDSKEIDFTNREFSRGSLFEVELYKELINIPCKYDNSLCNVALKMIKIPENERIDNLISKGIFINSDIEVIAKKLTIIYDNMPLPVDHFNYCNGLINGNMRIIESVIRNKNKKGFNNIYNAWSILNNKTINLNIVFKNRQLENKVKTLHGDLSFQNTFIHNGRYIMIDPCVAFYDMYAIDILYQFIDVIVELLRYKLDSLVTYLIKEYKRKIEEDISKELFDYYLFRHSLIRATVNWIFEDPNYHEYLQIRNEYAL